MAGAGLADRTISAPKPKESLVREVAVEGSTSAARWSLSQLVHFLYRLYLAQAPALCSSEGGTGGIMTYGQALPNFRAALLLLAVASASACSDTGECLFLLITAITAQVNDATTGVAICDAEVTATLGSTNESVILQPNADCWYTGAWKPGDYTLLARKTGYAEATQTVHVTSTGGHCPRANPVAVSMTLESNAN